MGIYWTVLACSVLFWWLVKLFGGKETFKIETQEIDNKQMMAYFVLISSFMIAMIGLRSESIGIDTVRYYNTYQRMGTRAFSYILDEEVAEKGYAFIQILFNKLHFNFYGFNLVYAVFVVSVISLLIYKKSVVPWLSYLLYFTFGFFILDFTMMRQTLAIAMVVLALIIDKNKGIKDFFIFAFLVYLASLFHTSAIVCIPLWFVKKIPFNKKSVFIFLLLIGISFLFKEYVIELFLRILNQYFEDYQDYSAEMISGTSGMRLYFMMLVTVLFSLYFHKHLSNPWNRFMFYCMCIVLIIFPAVQGGGAIMRIYYYFYIFMIVYIPNMLSALDRKKDFLYYWIIVAMYILVGLSQYSNSLSTNWYLIVPYQFFWQ